MSWNLYYQGREITIEVEPIEVKVTRFRAVAIDGDEREPVPYTTSDSPHIAEGLGAMAMMNVRASVRPSTAGADRKQRDSSA